MVRLVCLCVCLRCVYGRGVFLMDIHGAIPPPVAVEHWDLTFLIKAFSFILAPPKFFCGV